VVGVNTAVAGIGLGLAVPINAATRRIIGALMTDGRVRRAYLGIAGGPRPLPPRVRTQFEMRTAVEVVSVIEGSPADRAGLRAGDIVVGFDGLPLRTLSELQRFLDASRIAQPTVVRVVRRGELTSLTVVPAEAR
jgi:S1-C subfamily serine protease